MQVSQVNDTYLGKSCEGHPQCLFLIAPPGASSLELSWSLASAHVPLSTGPLILMLQGKSIHLFIHKWYVLHFKRGNNYGIKYISGA